MTHGKWFRKQNIPESVSTVFNLLKVCGIPATLGQVESSLLSHPDYPSLLAMAESLMDWGVRTEALQETMDDLIETGGPAIAHFEDDTFAVLVDIDPERVVIIRPGKREEQLSHDAFENIWSGVVLSVIPGSGNAELETEQDYRKNRNNEYMTFFRSLAAYVGLPALAVLSFAYGWVKIGNIRALLFLGIAKLIGVFLCAVMVGTHMGVNTRLSNFCPVGKVSNCLRVLGSRAGRLFGIPMADIGLVYFSGGFLTLTFSLLTNQAHQVESALFLLLAFNLPALAYTLFSVIYQFVVVRALCWLCLAVQGLFWIEYFILSRFLYPPVTGKPYTFNFSLPVVMGFGLALLVWFTLRPVIIDVQKVRLAERKLKRISRDPLYIQARLEQAEGKEMGDFPTEVEVGPKDAEFTITLILNPFCGRCGKDVRELARLIQPGYGNVRGVIRFIIYQEFNRSGDASQKDEGKGSLDYKMAEHIVLLAREGKTQTVMQALKKWYSAGWGRSSGQMDKLFETWRQKYPLSVSAAVDAPGVSGESAADILRMYREWVNKCGISGTPGVFLNGAELPGDLNLEDLRIFFLRQAE